MLTPDQVSFYRDNGYLVVPEVFTGDEIAELVAVTEDFERRGGELAESDNVFDIGQVTSRAPSRFAASNK